MTRLVAWMLSSVLMLAVLATPAPACEGGLSVTVGAEQRCLMPGDAFRECPLCPEMVVIPAGRFHMGSPASEEDRQGNEGPQRDVTIPQSFAVGRFEVTFAEWDACVAGGGCKCYRLPHDQGWGRGTYPVVDITWYQARMYVDWLTRTTGARYRLLSEAEWEYAARAGTSTAYATGETIGADEANFNTSLVRAGGHEARRRGRTAPVGTFAPNAFGLHDLHGNVWEWVEDCYHESHRGAPPDGSARKGGDCSERVLRGGSWSSLARFLRSAGRLSYSAFERTPGIGLRVARPLGP